MANGTDAEDAEASIGYLAELPLEEQLRITEEYDGVVDEDFEFVIAFNPEQIKSADPVTYDEGNVIPLSQRFDFSKRDIRYANGVKKERKDNTDASYKRGISFEYVDENKKRRTMTIHATLDDINALEPYNKVVPHSLTREELRQMYKELDYERNIQTGEKVLFYNSAFGKNHREGGLFNIELYENPIAVAYTPSHGRGRLDYDRTTDAKLRKFFELSRENKEQISEYFASAKEKSPKAYATGVEKERSGVQFANVGSTPTNLDDMITQDLLDLMHSHANNLQLRRNVWRHRAADLPASTGRWHSSVLLTVARWMRLWAPCSKEIPDAANEARKA